jgi:hypothetical protein
MKNFKEMTIDARINYFKEVERDIENKSAALKNLVNKRDAEMKAAFGITPNEQPSVMAFIETIREVINAPKSNIILP